MWLFVIPILVAKVLADDCPDNNDLYPCYCESSDDDAKIVCDHVSLDDLKNVLSNTKGLNVWYAFWGAELHEIPSNLFEGQISTSIDFAHCKIHSFGDRPFTGLEDTLTSISIMSSIDQEEKDLETFPLGHLKNLKNLDIGGNSFKRLGNDWFKDGPATLDDIYLNVNDIEELGDKAFASLVNLRVLKLSLNKISKISRSMFPQPASHLTELEFDNNEIETLPEDIFEDMPALRMVNVQANKLNTIPENTWGKVWDQLDEVHIGDVTCDENIKWIYQKSSGGKRNLPKILGARCEGGKHGGKDLDELTLEDFE